MSARSETSLMFAVRPLVVCKYVGQLLLVLSVLVAVPLVASLALGVSESDIRFGVLILILLGLSGLFSRLPAPRQVQWNEALGVTALAFVIAPLIMTYALATSGIGGIDAWFEAVSGTTTTGLSTLGRIEGRSSLFLFTRAWMQWYGGLGIAVLSVALVMRHHANTRRFLESSGEEAIAASATVHARRIFAVYVLITLAGILAIWAAQGDFFVATIHALAAVSTGGFSSFDDSLAGMSLAARAVVIVFAVFGAISLPLYYGTHREGLKVLARDAEVRALIFAILATAGGLILLLHALDALSWDLALGHGLLLGASAQSTAGFSDLDVGALNPASKLVLIFSMFVGGCSGSTAGGVKLVRILILLRLIQLTLRRSAAPARAVMPLTLNGEPLDSDTISNALLLLGLWVLVIAASWLPFLFYGYDPLDSLFEVVSATGTVGLSTGITASSLDTALKLVLGVDMLFGRVEVIALLVVLYPPTWLGRRRNIK
jgi:trk system potassium uptake protein